MKFKEKINQYNEIQNSMNRIDQIERLIEEIKFDKSRYEKSVLPFLFFLQGVKAYLEDKVENL